MGKRSKLVKHKCIHLQDMRLELEEATKGKYTDVEMHVSAPAAPWSPMLSYSWRSTHPRRLAFWNRPHPRADLTSIPLSTSTEGGVREEHRGLHQVVRRQQEERSLVSTRLLHWIA